GLETADRVFGRADVKKIGLRQPPFGPRQSRLSTPGVKDARGGVVGGTASGPEEGERLMDLQDGGSGRAWEGAARHLRRAGLDFARGLADLVLPPLAHDSPEATAAAGLTPDAWSRIRFLEAPVCDGCGAAFEFDGGPFAETRCAACIAQPYV
ncbi:Phosphoribosyl transferase domain protein, partial [Streptomyces coelicoflavus ZG0656]